MKNIFRSLKLYKKLICIILVIGMAFALTACGTVAKLEIEKELIDTGIKQVTRNQEEADLSNLYEIRAAIECYAVDKGLGGDSIFRVILDTNRGCIRIERPNGVGGTDFLTAYGINDSDHVVDVFGDWSGSIICTYENSVWTDNAHDVHGQYRWADGSSY